MKRVLRGCCICLPEVFPEIKHTDDKTTLDLGKAVSGKIRVEPRWLRDEHPSGEPALEANGRIGEHGFSSLAAATGSEINFKQLPCLSNL